MLVNSSWTFSFKELFLEILLLDTKRIKCEDIRIVSKSTIFLCETVREKEVDKSIIYIIYTENIRELWFQWLLHYKKLIGWGCKVQ